MKSNLRNEIKSYIVRQGMTMQEVVDLLRDEHGWSDSVSNLSNKLQRESLRYIGGCPACRRTGVRNRLATEKVRRDFYMTEAEKKLLQAQHRLEEAQARDRVKERKMPERAGSFRRVQFWKRCCRRCGRWNRLCWRSILCTEASRQHDLSSSWEVSGKPGAFLFFSRKGALTHHL